MCHGLFQRAGGKGGRGTVLLNSNTYVRIRMRKSQLSLMQVAFPLFDSIPRRPPNPASSPAYGRPWQGFIIISPLPAPPLSSPSFAAFEDFASEKPSFQPPARASLHTLHTQTGDGTAFLVGLLLTALRTFTRGCGMGNVTAGETLIRSQSIHLR